MNSRNLNTSTVWQPPLVAELRQKLDEQIAFNAVLIEQQKALTKEVEQLREALEAGEREAVSTLKHFIQTGHDHAQRLMELEQERNRLLQQIALQRVHLETIKSNVASALKHFTGLISIYFEI